MFDHTRVLTWSKGSLGLVGELFEVRTQVDRDLTTVSRVDRLLGLNKNLGRHSRCSCVVCPFQRVWGAFYRQGRSVERVGPISQVRPDQGVQPALWSTVSRLCCSWSLLLRQLSVGSLGRFWAGTTVGRCGRPSRCGQPTFAVGWIACTQRHLGLPWNDGCGDSLDRQVDPLIQVILTSSIWSNRCFLGRSHSSKLCLRERRCIGLGMSHEAGPAAPGRAGHTCRTSRTSHAGRTCRTGRAWWCGRA
jgi:hypothetical protein